MSSTTKNSQMYKNDPWNVIEYTKISAAPFCGRMLHSYPIDVTLDDMLSCAQGNECHVWADALGAIKWFHHVSSLSASRSTVSLWKLFDQPGSWYVDEIQSLLVTHSMKNIYETYIFVGVTPYYLLDIINLPSISKKTIWLAINAMRF